MDIKIKNLITLTKYIFFIYLLLYNISCSKLEITDTKDMYNSNNKKWITARELRNNYNFLQIGDVIIKNKTLNPVSWWGHAGLIVDFDTIGDYPHYGSHYYEIDVFSWLYEDRKVVALRYKDLTPEFLTTLIKNINQYKNKKYWIGLNKKNNKKFYCSQFIWFVYWKTGQDLGFELNIDSDSGFIVTPYDLLYSKHFININKKRYRNI